MEALKLGPRGRSALGRLIAQGFLRRVSFTPSDAAHVLDLHNEWDGEAAQKAAAIFARQKGNDGRPVAEDAVAMAQMVIDALTRRSAELVLEAALAEDGFEADGLASTPLAAAAMEGRRGFAAPTLSLTAPLIGLGASAATYYPAVARMAGAEPAIAAGAALALATGLSFGVNYLFSKFMVFRPGHQDEVNRKTDEAP